MSNQKRQKPKSRKKIPDKKTKRSILEKYPKRIANLLRSIKNGLPYETACKISNIPPSAFYEWRQKGIAAKQKGIENIYSKFVDKLEKAEAEAEARAIIQIQKAGVDKWQALAWFLERRFPQRWRQQAQGVEDELEIEFDFEIIKEGDKK